VPFTQADVAGYDAITGDVPMARLAAEKRLFVVDFMPLYREGLLVAAPDSYLEVPTAVFFLTDPSDEKRGRGGGGSGGGGDTSSSTSSNRNKNKHFRAKRMEAAAGKRSVRLMPLAIKFNVYNENVYSPKDTRADWMLAKAAFNALDRDVNAIHHLVLHAVLANIAISANKHLAHEHPLTRPILMAATHNFGIIFNGFGALFSPAGLLDSYLQLGGPPALTLLFPHNLRTFNWQRAFLSTDLAARGVADIPGFLYRDDAGDIYDALHAYVKQYLDSFYQTPRDVQGDAELAAFLAPLSNATDAYTPSNVAYIKGFPSPGEMRTPDDVARILTQVLWMAGVQHHALNSFRILKYDRAYWFERRCS
jgi:hypothetical protein